MMKFSKAAAVVAGSVAALGASVPAFAADAPAMPPMSATGGATEALNSLAPVTESLPQTVGNGIAEQGQTVDKLVGTAREVNRFRNDAPGELLGAANGVTHASPLLGGVKLNGGAG